MSKTIDGIFEKKSFQDELYKIGHAYFFERLNEVLTDMFSIETLQHMGQNLLFGGGTYYIDTELHEKNDYAVMAISGDEYQITRILARKVLQRGATPYLFSDEAKLLWSDVERRRAMQAIVVAAMVFQKCISDMDYQYQHKQAGKIVNAYDKDVLQNAYILSQLDSCDIDSDYTELTLAEYIQHHIQFYAKNHPYHSVCLDD